jgi:hypothetical protein
VSLCASDAIKTAQSLPGRLERRSDLPRSHRALRAFQFCLCAPTSGAVCTISRTRLSMLAMQVQKSLISPLLMRRQKIPMRRPKIPLAYVGKCLSATPNNRAKVPVQLNSPQGQRPNPPDKCLSVWSRNRDEHREPVIQGRSSRYAGNLHRDVSPPWWRALCFHSPCQR